ITEAALFRGFFDLGSMLGFADQRIGAVGALSVFLIILLLLEFPIARGLLNIGRHLEIRLRMAFLEKIPRLGDRYFQSRPTSDMAERSHSIHQVRQFPDLATQLVRTLFELVLTAAAIAWIDPGSAGAAALLAVLALSRPLVAQPLLRERDLRVRTHAGALGRFYLDAMLGLVAVRTHSAEHSVRREHEALLVDWSRAGLGLQHAVVSVEGAQLLLGFGLAAWLLFNRLGHGGDPGSGLLLAYWALNLPLLGHELAPSAWQ